MKENKKNIPGIIGVVLFALSLILSFYSNVLLIVGKDYDKTKNIFNGSIYDSAYCDFINGKLSFNFVLIFIAIITIIFIVIMIIDVIKRKKFPGKILLAFVMSIILCATALNNVKDCSGLDDTWNGIENQEVTIKD